MKFSTVAEAFNYYKDKDVKALEKRAAVINADIDINPDADIEAYNIELQGIKEAKENIEQRSTARKEAELSLITGRKIKLEEPKTFDGDDAVSTPEYRSAFYKKLMGRTLNFNEQAAFDAVTEKRADAFSSSTDTAAAIPTQTLNEVIKKARTMGGLIAEARAFRMPANIAIPIGTPSTNAAWHTEGAKVDSEKLTLASVTFGAYEIIKIFFA